MTTTSKQTSVLFEDDTGYVTTDGRLIQKDNRYFKGRELAQVPEDQVEEAIAYYKVAFEKLTEYVDKSLKIINQVEEPDQEKLQQLTREIEQADALGDFDTLLDRVQAALPGHDEQQDKSAGEQEVAESDPDSGADGQQAETPSDSVDGQQSREKPEDVAGDTLETVEETSDTSQEKTGDVEEIKSEDTVADSEQTAAEDQDQPQETEAEAEAEATEESTEKEGEEDDTDSAMEEHPSAQDEEKTVSESISEEEVTDAFEFYRKLTESAENLAEQTDWQVVQHEFDNLKLKWEEAGQVPEEKQSEYEELRQRFNQAEQNFKERREQHYQQQQEKRQKNLQQREQLLEKMRQLVKEEKWSSFNEVKQIQRRWENIKNLPAEEAQKQQEEFDKLLQTFEDNKVDYLVEKRQKEEDNLTGKLVILDKIEEIVNQAGPNTVSWQQLDEEIQQLSRHWRKVGRVPKEQTDQIWDRYRSLLDQYHAKKYEHNEAYRKELDKNLKKRESLCEQAEKLKDEEDLAVAARKVNQLHKQWKKVGPVPHEKNEELWQRFKAASDEFNKYKQEHLEDLKEQEQTNLDKKLELCEKAEEIRDSENWDHGANQMNELMEQWKQIGPAPRRKAGKVWKRFKKAMDDYFEKRRQHFREIRKEQKENYRKKREIIDKIREQAEREDIQEAVNDVRELQEEFKSIGFVPIKKKDKVWKDYKEACDLFYGKAREESSPKAKQQSSDSGTKSGGSDSDKIQKEINKLRSDCERLNDEIVQYSNSKEFIKPNKKGIQLREEIQQKIDKAEAKLEEKNERIKQLQRQLQDTEG